MRNNSGLMSLVGMQEEKKGATIRNNPFNTHKTLYKSGPVPTTPI